MEQLILDHMLKEEFSFPDPSFPIQFYIDDLHQWPDGRYPCIGILDMKFFLLSIKK